MSIATIEARAIEFMGKHKGDLAALLAKAEAKLIELGHDVTEMFGEAPAPAMEQGTDPVIIDVAPASTEPEDFDPDVIEGTDATPVDNAAIEGADAAPVADEPAKEGE